MADRLLSDYNTRLRKLEGLGAVAPDGRENPEQEGPGSYDARWLKMFRQHNQNGLSLAGNKAIKLKNQGLLQWNADIIQSEKAELAEMQALRVL